jgi:hypothetical protein
MWTVVPLAALLLCSCTTTTPRSSEPTTPATDPADEEVRTRALAAQEAASQAAERARASGSAAEDLLQRADEAYERAQVARYNSMWRAATGLFQEATEYYTLAVQVAPVSPVATETRMEQAIEIPEATPVPDASPQAVAAMFDEVDRAQRMAYMGGGLQAGAELVKEADALLWDAQIAQQGDQPDVALGLLTRILALYTEAHRQGLQARSQVPEGGGAETGHGPVRWASSLAAARRAAQGEQQMVLLFLYDRLDPQVAGLFADAQVCAAMESLQAAKHRVTDIVAGVDPVLLSRTDLEVQGLIDSYALRSFPAILLLDASGDYLDSTAGISTAQEILDLLGDVR